MLALTDPIEVTPIFVLVVPVLSAVAGQLQLLYRFTRVGGGPGTFRRTLRERRKQHRSIIVLDAISGLIGLAAVAFVGPAGAMATLFENSGPLGWILLSAVAPFATAGFVRGAVVQGLLKPKWLRRADEDELVGMIFGLQVLREESVDLLVRTLWKFVRTTNERAYAQLKRCIEEKISAGEMARESFVADVNDYFAKRRVTAPPAVAKALDGLHTESQSADTNEQRLHELASALLNTENWDPLERLCGDYR